MTNTTSGVADATRASNADAPTFLEILIDETGSMARISGSTIAAFNGFVADQKGSDATCLVTLTKFASGKSTTPYQNVPVQMVPRLTSTTFVPEGGTNLYDTMLLRAKTLMDTIGDAVCNIIFLVITDGDDNMSAKGSLERVQQMIPERMGAGWTFVYLGAHPRAIASAMEMGFPDNNVKQFESSNEEMSKAMKATSNATTFYRAMRASGAVAAGTTSTTYFSGE